MRPYAATTPRRATRNDGGGAVALPSAAQKADPLAAAQLVRVAARRTESGANSDLGKAITYLLRHWKALTLFLRQPTPLWTIIFAKEP
jgi:hypothetical protein